MATGKVRIFELAKEVGLSSKELITLFNERLGGVFEAKNQLSVVPEHIAELVRSVLLKRAAPAAKAEAKPAAPAAETKAPARAKAPAAEKPATPTAPDEPVPQLKPVPATSKRTAPARPTATAKPVPEPPSDGAAAAVAATPEVIPEAPAPAKPAAPPQRPAASVQSRPVASAQPRPTPPAAPHTPIPRLKPVPSGQTTVLPPRRQAPPPTTTASASPGPATGIPGRPGVAPRPGQAGGAPQAPVGADGRRVPQPGRLISPAPQRRPQGNGPFRPLAPPGGRPFGPRPGGTTGPSVTDTPAPSSGGRPGDRSRDRDDKLNKKDREKELLLEKERNRKKRIESAPQPPPAKLETIEIPDLLTVQELATSMIVPAKDVIKELIKMGTMATINQNIPADVAISVAKKFGFNAVVKEAGEEVVVEQEEDKPEMLTARPPVVTVLGHVDHGKTSLLDKIRTANVAAGEAGGITQRIGAYTVDRNDRKITFIDTPGHEAFTAMRARGAKVTDVAILVVAADDGVMPQTKEAISHAKAANVPIVVAMNKMDKPEAQPERVKQQLADNGLQSVDWGGNIETVPVSARTGEGIDSLLETVLLEADIRELKANKNRRATGVVIEAALHPGRGPVATVLVQNGTLRVGDVIVVGGTYGKVRALVDDKGKQVKKAGPSIPVEIMGLRDVPAAGESLMVVSDERVARETAETRKTRRRDVRIAAAGGQRVSLETFMQMPAEGKKTLNIIVKADGQGSVEALRARMEQLSTEEVDIRVIFGGVGAITENDVNLASASNAVLIGFNIRPDETAKRLAENEGVDLRFYQVIYNVEDDLRNAMRGMLAPVEREVTLGHAEVREVFKVSKVGSIAGCYVTDGKITRNSKVRVVRDAAVIFTGELESLRRFKDDVREVAEGYECGIQVARYQDLKVGDVIEAYTTEQVAAELTPA
ncbi:MAG: translation initiation factor IF-2 [Candidatus Eremiobacteraeota bacterium]|nr:translation initiation factor IF-2 [Candidatus Eremiobacteraeota bacterium]